MIEELVEHWDEYRNCLMEGEMKEWYQPSFVDFMDYLSDKFKKDEGVNMLKAECYLCKISDSDYTIFPACKSCIKKINHDHETK